MQRLLNIDGVPMAYRLVSMDDVRHHKSDSEAYFLSVDAPYPNSVAESATNIFLWVAPRRFDANVFDTYGVDCLRNAGKNKIILLDEIGGVDLLSLGFRELITDMINGPTPCIGIMKEIEKARDAQSYNRELRALLNIQQISSNDLPGVSSIVNSFLLSQGL